MKLAFLIKTALLDARTQWGKLVLFIASIILGISALVAINSFNDNIVADIDNQSASLLGADLVVSGNKQVTEDLAAMLDSLPGEKATEHELLSMAYIPKSDGSQFVRLKAIEGGFPYYGEFLTTPASANEEFRKTNGLLVDDGFLKQFKLSKGDSIKLGNKILPISGSLDNNPGGTGIGSGFAPTIYLSLDALKSTDLMQAGSMIDYSYFYQVGGAIDVDEWKKKRRLLFSNESMRVRTINDQRENLEEAFNALNTFLNLVALVSLLLGCIGVASSVFIYIKNKVNTIAVYRCLGMKANQAFFIFFFQIMILGVLGSIVGAALGSFIQVVLPRVFSDLLPFAIETSISWPSIFQGLSLGFVITSLFAMIPLLGIRNVSPLRTIRSIVEEGSQARDPWTYLVYVLIILSLFIYLYSLTQSFRDAGIFILGLLFAFFLLYLFSKLLIWAIRRFFPTSWSFVFRQGLSNLYRPNNQTQILLVTLGLGTAILSTLFIVQGLILENVSSFDEGEQPNTILFGIESNQIEDLKTKTLGYDMPVVEEVPIVTMRIAGWQGRTKADWLADTTRTARRWAINREIRVTYRDTIDDSEKLIAGNFVGSVNPGDSIFISLDEGYAEDLDVGLGDEIEFNVQGMLIKTYVSSFREIDFTSMRTRFFIVFPRGVLEQAPQFQVLVTKSPNEDVLNAYRSDVVKTFPNVSVVDLSSILKTLNDILSKISYAVQFMAGFSILTGIIVLLSSLLLSKFQRVKESVLLRTLGASRAQILKIYATEYAIIGTLSAATGIILSLLASWLLVTFQLDLDFRIQYLPLLLVFLFIVSLTVLTGLWMTKDVVQKSPLETLRKDV